jgi:hypothetical protein
MTLPVFAINCISLLSFIIFKDLFLVKISQMQLLTTVFDAACNFWFNDTFKIIIGPCF